MNIQIDTDGKRIYVMQEVKVYELYAWLERNIPDSCKDFVIIPHSLDSVFNNPIINYTTPDNSLMTSNDATCSTSDAQT